MSIKVQTLVWDHFPHGHTKLLVMLKLADIASDDGGDIYPSVARVARACKTSARQIQRIMTGFIEEGFLIHVGMKPIRTKGGIQKVNEYQIDLDVLVSQDVEQAEQGGDNMTPPETPKGGDISAKGVTDLNKGGDIAMSPDSSFNPSSTTLYRAREESDQDPQENPYQETYDGMRKAGREFRPMPNQWRSFFMIAGRFDLAKSLKCMPMYGRLMEAGCNLGDADDAMAIAKDNGVTVSTPAYYEGQMIDLAKDRQEGVATGGNNNAKGRRGYQSGAAILGEACAAAFGPDEEEQAE